MERVDIFAAELGYSREIVAASALVDCVLGHCWGLEDESIGPNWHEGVELAAMLCRRLGL